MPSQVYFDLLDIATVATNAIGQTQITQIKKYLRNRCRWSINCYWSPYGWPTGQKAPPYLTLAKTDGDKEDLGEDEAGREPPLL